MSPPTTIDWTKIKALTFDIYGTLVDWDNGVIRAARTTALGQHINASDQEMLKSLETHCARIEREKPTKRKSEINSEAFEIYAGELGLVRDGKVTGREVEEAAREFGGAIGGFEAFGDTVRFFVVVMARSEWFFAYRYSSPRSMPSSVYRSISPSYP